MLESRQPAKQAAAQKAKTKIQRKIPAKLCWTVESPSVSARVGKNVKILLQRQRQGEQIRSVPAHVEDLAGDKQHLSSCVDHLL